jgi:hypothetical protein
VLLANHVHGTRHGSRFTSQATVVFQGRELINMCLLESKRRILITAPRRIIIVETRIRTRRQPQIEYLRIVFAGADPYHVFLDIIQVKPRVRKLER